MPMLENVELEFVPGYQGEDLKTGQTRNGDTKWGMKARFIDGSGKEAEHLVWSTNELRADYVGQKFIASVTVFAAEPPRKPSYWVNLKEKAKMASEAPQGEKSPFPPEATETIDLGPPEEKPPAQVLREAVTERNRPKIDARIKAVGMLYSFAEEAVLRRHPWCVDSPNAFAKMIASYVMGYVINAEAFSSEPGGFIALAEAEIGKAKALAAEAAEAEKANAEAEAAGMPEDGSIPF